jgi:hypothetical protein
LQIDGFSLARCCSARGGNKYGGQIALHGGSSKVIWELIRGKIVTQPVAVKEVQGGCRELAVHLLARLPARPQLRGMEQPIFSGNQFNHPASAGGHNVIDGHRNSVVIDSVAEHDLLRANAAVLGLVVQGEALQMVRQAALKADAAGSYSGAAYR